MSIPFPIPTPNLLKSINLKVWISFFLYSQVVNFREHFSCTPTPEGSEATPLPAPEPTGMRAGTGQVTARASRCQLFPLALACFTTPACGPGRGLGEMPAMIGRAYWKIQTCICTSRKGAPPFFRKPHRDS